MSPDSEQGDGRRKKGKTLQPQSPYRFPTFFESLHPPCPSPSASSQFSSSLVLWCSPKTHGHNGYQPNIMGNQISPLSNDMRHGAAWGVGIRKNSDSGRPLLHDPLHSVTLWRIFLKQSGSKERPTATATPQTPGQDRLPLNTTMAVASGEGKLNTGTLPGTTGPFKIQTTDGCWCNQPTKHLDVFVCLCFCSGLFSCRRFCLKTTPLF